MSVNGLSAFVNESCITRDDNILLNNTLVEKCSAIAGGNVCENLYDLNLVSGWTTIENSIYDIPDNLHPEVILTYNHTKWTFRYLDIYVEDFIGGDISSATPTSMKIDLFYEGGWHTIATPDNLSDIIGEDVCYNNDGQAGRCARIEANAQEVEKIRMNISGVYNDEGTQDNLIMRELSACGNPACEYPAIFCDLFNYQSSLMDAHNWTVFNGDGSTDSGLAPTSNELVLISDTYKSPYHSYSKFPVNYHVAKGELISLSLYAPVYSTEFRLNPFANSTDCFSYYGTDLLGRGVADLQFCGNGSAYYSDGDGYVNLCDGCIAPDSNNRIKINYFFAQRDEFGFNSTVQNDLVSVYVNQTKIGDINSFINPSATNIKNLYFVKPSGALGIIDDYYFMLGTDKEEDTLPIYYDDITSLDNITRPQGDFYEETQTLWEQFGLRSLSSRILFGLAVLMIWTAMLIGGMIGTMKQVNVPTLMILDLLMIIIMVFVRLLPIWILFILLIIGIGILLGARALQHR
jgi:hypothetical protein